jgi:predicted nucleic acid-binding protein
MELLLVDTSAFYALSNTKDPHHRAAVAIVRQLETRGARAFTTNYVVAETHALISIRKGHQAARKWLGRLSIAIEQATVDDQVRGVSTVLEYTDKSYSLIDAISFSVMKRLGVSRAFTFDRHFTQHGFEVEVAGH